MDFSVYWQLFRRRIPMFILFVTICGGGGLWLAMTLPPQYQTQAVLIVETGQIPDELAASTVQTGEIEALQIIRQRILSRAVLLEMANKIGVYDDDLRLGVDEKVVDLRERIDIQTRGGEARRGVSDATIVTVGFTAPNPAMTASMVNEIVTIILQTNVEMRTSVARQTFEFFDQEVARLELELTEINSQILTFQENNIDSLPDSIEFRRERQVSLQERLLQLEREQATLNDRRAQLVTLFETTGSILLDGQANSQGVAFQRLRPEEQNLADLKAEMSSLSAVLSPNNPRIVLLQSRIEAAEALVAALPVINATDGENTDTQTSLFDLQMTDVDAQILYIEDQKAATQAQMAEIDRSIEATPGNAVSLSTLERTAENLREQYNQAIANKARAETGSMIEALSRGQRISVVEQAVPPTTPSSPNRPLVLAAGIGLGLFLAAALAFLLEILNRSVRHPKDIQKGLGIEVFATIPYITAPQETARASFRRVIVAVVFIGVIAGGLWYVDQNVRPLQPIIERLLGFSF